MEALLTIPEAAKTLKIGTSTLRRYLRRRVMPYVVLPGNDYRIKEPDLKKFIEERLVGVSNLQLISGVNEFDMISRR